MQNKFSILFMAIAMFVGNSSFGQSVTVDELLHLKDIDSVYMKNLFDSKHFYLAKVTRIGKKINYLYDLDSNNEIGIQALHINDTIFQIVWVTYRFGDVKIYDEIRKTLKKDRFYNVPQPPENEKKFHCEVVVYRQGDLVLSLTNNEPESALMQFNKARLKSPYEFWIQRFRDLAASAGQ